MAMITGVYLTNGTSTTLTNTYLYDSFSNPFVSPAGSRVEQVPVAPALAPRRGPEDPIAWLRRRVDEMCWVPGA